MLKPRDVQSHVLRLASQYPVVTITGPRQSGKTTLCRMTFPEWDYVSLENPDDRAYAQGDPRGFMEEHRDPLVIDEAQRVPELLSYIQGVVDGRGNAGQFILTGSAQFELIDSIAQSLAGRTAIVRLLPFTYTEAYGKASGGTEPALNSVLYRGLYPRAHAVDLVPTELYSFYVETYLERDVRALVNVRDRSTFELFLRLCAGRTGQLLNMTALSNDVGVSVPTIKSWISVLEASSVTMLLRPHHANFRKRLVKSPKLYFLDTGLVAYLLGITDAGQMATHPLRGALFETFVVSELVKQGYNRIRRPNLSFFRDSGGHEIDILLDRGATVAPVEVKSAATIADSFFDGLTYYRNLNAQSESGTLVYGGTGNQTRRGHQVIDFRSLDQIDVGR